MTSIPPSGPRPGRSAPAAVCLLAVGIAAVTAPARADEPRLALDFRDAEIANVIESVAVATGEAFAFDADIQGRVTIAVPRRVTFAEALEILHTALLMKGLAAVPAPGGVRRIVRIESTASQAPWTLDAPRSDRGNIVTTSIPLRSADASEMLTLLDPMLAESMLGRVYEPSNSLILAGPEHRLRRLLTIVQALDEAEERERTILRLRHREAAGVSALIEEALQKDGGPPSPLTLVVDERTNALILEGSPRRIEEVRSFVRRLDTPLVGGGRLKVVPVRNADPADLAGILGQLASAPAARPGAAGSAPALPLAGRDFALAVDEPTSALLIRTDPDTFGLLADVISELDQVPRQISVEVLVLEVTTRENLRLGFDAFLPLESLVGGEGGDARGLVQWLTSGTRALVDPDEGLAGTVRFQRAPALVSFTDETGAVVTREIQRESAALVAENRDIQTRTLLNPHLVVLNGEEHEIFSGAEVPIPVTSQSGQTDPAGRLTTQQDIERQSIGTRLIVRPELGQEGTVRLGLDLEVTGLTASIVGDVDLVGPTIRSQSLDAEILLRPGEVALIAGADLPAVQRQENGVPFLRSIPVLGQLFRSTRDETVASRLVVTAQARALPTPAEMVADSIRQRLAFQRSQVRLAGLTRTTDAPYAVLVTTRASRGDADAIASDLSTQGKEARVVKWTWHGQSHFDVYLTGFATLPDAAEAATSLADRSWEPSLAVVPDRRR